jgi:hypothetical protein
MDQRAYRPAMSELAVIAKTGKGWDAWFDLLDKLGAMRMDHKSIVKLLGDKYRVGPWWRQMVAVEYERARGRRAVNQKGSGYSVSVSRTMLADVPAMYLAAADARRRHRWFPKGVVKVTSLTENKYFRSAWNGEQRLEINFYARPGGKAQIVVQVDRLADEAAVERERQAWKKALVKLEAMLSD